MKACVLACRIVTTVAAVATAAGAAEAATKTSPNRPAADGVCHMGEANFFRDQGLTMKLSTKLQFNKALLREKINVKVSSGVATLSGGVSTPEHIALAASIAGKTEGIVCVNNFLKVGPPEPAPDPSGMPR